MIIYHGSQFVISSPEYGKGKLHNDYGQDFYCTENIEIGKEWKCSDTNNGILNIYKLDITNLKILNLNDPKFSILHWITLLIKNREFRLTSQISKNVERIFTSYFFNWVLFKELNNYTKRKTSAAQTLVFLNGKVMQRYLQLNHILLRMQLIS